MLVRWRKFTEFLAGVEGAELPLRTQALLTGNRLKANVPFHAWLVKPLLVGEKMKFGAFLWQRRGEDRAANARLAEQLGFESVWMGCISGFPIQRRA